MIIGYVRVSTLDQSLDAQVQAIEKYARENNEDFFIYEEKASGTKKDRPELKKAIEKVKTVKNGKFVIYKLDRLARSSIQLFNIADDLKASDVEFISLRDNIDTTTATGKAMFGMLSVFAEFERDVIAERTRAGLEVARSKGRLGGRPGISKQVKKEVKKKFDEGYSATDIAKLQGICRSTVYKILNEFKGDC